MTTRTTETVVRFSSPFMLAGFDEAQPAGDYRVDQDEELLEAFSRLAWRRVAAFIYLPAIGRVDATQRMVRIELSELDAAIDKDAQEP